MAIPTAWRMGAIGAGLWLALLAGTARAAGPDGALIVAHGVRAVPACATCHGAQGQGNPGLGAPRLAGDGVDYLRRQLAAFAADSRVNPIMQPIAHGLTAPERVAVARFFAGLPGLVPRPVPVAADRRGAKLALRGRWKLGLPGCTQCHGPGGMGVPPSFPHLAGLTATYIAQQLGAFRAGQRPAGPLGLMGRVARKLSPADIAAVSAYFAAAGGFPSKPGGPR